MDPIIQVNDRGQITIPAKLRKKMGTRLFVCKLEDDCIKLEPMQTREEYLAELDAAEKDYEENGGIPLADVIAELEKEHEASL